MAFQKASSLFMVCHKATHLLWPRKHVSRAVIGQILLDKCQPAFPKASSLSGKQVPVTTRFWESLWFSETLRAGFESKLSELANHMWKPARFES